MKFAIFTALLFFATMTFAQDKTSIMFFSSNNTGEISVETAYERLIGKEQHALQNKIIHILQKNHIEQGKFKDILGTYSLSSSQHVTADNTDVFNTSPYQALSNEQVFALAKDLAIKLKQESVAVFIPTHNQTIGDLTVRFTTHQPTITEIIEILHTKLPPSYSQAFSLHLSNEYADFNKVRIARIEWLGSKTKLNELQQAFPQEKITYRYGIAYLVYKNGQKEPL